MANAPEVPELEDDEPDNTAKQVIVTIILVIVFILAVLVNSVVIIVFCRVKRLRRPVFYLVLNLAVADLLGALWVLFCIITASQWDWTLGTGLCKFQGFLAYLCLALNMHTMLAIAVEKFMKILFPSKHVDAFRMKAVVIVLLMGLWIFDLVVAMLPLVGWSEYYFFDFQFQCAINHVVSVTHLNFMFVVVIAIPFLSGVVLYLLVVNRVRNLGQKVTPTGQQVLQEYEDVPKESFAEKLQKQQDKFRFAGMKKKKPTLGKAGGKTAADETEEYDDSTDNETYGDGEAVNNYEDARRAREARRRKKKKRLYIFKRHDFTLAMNMWLAWAVYFLLWFPYIVVGYCWTYKPKTVSDGLYTAVTCFIFFGLICKPFIYVINKQLRTGLVAAFQRNKKKSPTYPKQPVEKEAFHNVDDRMYSSTTTNEQENENGGYRRTTTTTTTTTKTRRGYYD